MGTVIRRRRDWLVQVELTPDEAENLASGLGPDDLGRKELEDLAAEARQRQYDWDGVPE